MSDSTVYDLLEKLVNEQKDNLKKYQELYGVDQKESMIGINTIQSIVRRSVIEEMSEEPSYARVVYTKDGYQSIKLNNLKFDFDFILALLSNVSGVIVLDRWAIIMVILTMVVQLSKCNVRLSPAVGMIVTYLYGNGYQVKKERYISEEDLLHEMREKYSAEENLFPDSAQFHDCITDLEKLKVISLKGGEVALLEEIKV